MTERVSRTVTRPEGDVGYGQFLQVGMVGESIPSYAGTVIDGTDITTALMAPPNVLVIDGLVTVSILADADHITVELWADHGFRSGITRIMGIAVVTSPLGVVWGDDAGNVALSSQATVAQFQCYFPRIEYARAVQKVG